MYLAWHRNAAYQRVLHQQVGGNVQVVEFETRDAELRGRAMP